MPEKILSSIQGVVQPSNDPTNGTPNTFIFAYGDGGVPVKRYYGGGQQLAARFGDKLYFTLNDPTGTSLAMADANGNDMGRMLYDGYGGVLTSTLPLTLTMMMPELPDADTGLVHMGGGRWYDPALGRPLQPNPAGGPPTVPQALNRYVATSLGQPGVAQAAANENFLTNWTQGNWYRQGASAFFACATCILSEIEITQQLYRPRFTLGSRVFLSEDVFRKVGNNTFKNIKNGDIWTDEQLLLGVFEPDELEVRWVGSRQVDNVLKKIVANTAGRIALNVGVAAIFDVGFETLEAATHTGRWANPYWTQEQKLLQARTSIVGDLGIVLAIAWWNPSLWVAIPTYAVASITWSYIHPIIFPNQFVETRNLAPLQP